MRTGYKVATPKEDLHVFLKRIVKLATGRTTPCPTLRRLFNRRGRGEGAEIAEKDCPPRPLRLLCVLCGFKNAKGPAARWIPPRVGMTYYVGLEVPYHTKHPPCGESPRFEMKKIKQIIEDTDTRAGRTFDLFIQALIVLSLITFTLDTLPDLSTRTSRVLDVLEVITVMIFTVEYLLRVIVADRKLKYVLSFYGLIDLLAILPFYVARGIDLRAIRILRLFRLLRVLKLARYSKALRHFKLAINEIKEELILYFVLTMMLLFIASVGIYYFEHDAQPEQFKSVFHCMWWAIATLTTVGYGDIYPITLGGRLFTGFILLLGLGLVAIPSGLLASAFKQVHEDKPAT